MKAHTNRSLLLLYAGLVFLAGLSGLTSCHRDKLKAEQDVADEAVNSPSPAVALAGEYLAVYVKWLGPYGPGVEGQSWSDTPNSTIKGNYRLTVEVVPPSAGKLADSVYLFLEGSGYGPTFARTALGKFGISAAKPGGGVTGQVVYTNYQLYDQFSKPDDNRVQLARHARVSETVYVIDVTPMRITASTAVDKGRYMPYSPARWLDGEMVGQFVFKRVTKGVVDGPK